MTKLLENIFRSVNIALVNELAMLADRMEIDIWEVVDAASPSPTASCASSPAPGWVATACPSTRSTYLACTRVPHVHRVHRARRQDQPADALLLRRAHRAGAQRRAKPVKGSRILILGASYKGGVGDIRESPALRIMEVLGDRGAHRLQRPVRSRAGRARAAERRARRRARRRGRRRARDGAPRHRLRAVASVGLFVDLRGATRGLRVENLVRL